MQWLTPPLYQCPGKAEPLAFNTYYFDHNPRDTIDLPIIIKIFDNILDFCQCKSLGQGYVRGVVPP